MGMSIVKSFSILVASGQGDRCNTLRSTLHDNLLQVDEKTGLMKVFLFKEGRGDPKYKDDHFRIGRDLSKIIQPILAGIPAHFYGPDAAQPNEKRS